MFSLNPVLEGRYIVHKIRGSVAVHFISTLATRYRARHTLWRESIPALLDFLLKLLFAEHISSVSLCHLSSLPQLSARTKCSLRPSVVLAKSISCWCDSACTSRLSVHRGNAVLICPAGRSSSRPCTAPGVVDPPCQKCRSHRRRREQILHLYLSVG